MIRLPLPHLLTFPAKNAKGYYALLKAQRSVQGVAAAPATIQRLDDEGSFMVILYFDVLKLFSTLLHELVLFSKEASENI